MSKKFTSFLVVLAALLLTVPTQAQFAKKAAKQTTVLKAGPLKVNDVQKVKAAKMKAAAKYEGQAFTSKVFNSYLQAGLEKVQEDKAILEKQMEENLRQVKFGKMASILNKGNVSAKAIKNARAIALDAAKPSARRATNRAEVVDANGIITSPAEGESKMYDRAGMGYYVQSQQLYVGEQSGKTEIVETTDGVVYIKNFISNVNTGAWVKGTKNGNTITVSAGQVIYYGTSYGLYIAKCSYVDDETGWAEVDGDITLTVDGNTISLDNTDEDHPVAAFWTDDNSFSGYGDYATVFSYDPDYVAPTLVELPEGATVETWYSTATAVKSSGNATVEGSAKVAFVGDDVYLSGIFSNYPDSWIKGTIDGTTVTFSGLQFLGTYSSFDIYAVGSNGYNSSAELQDFKMTYDATSKKFTSVNSLLANAKKDAVYFLEAYEGISITKDAPAEEVATTGANVDVLPYTNTLGTEDEFAQFGVIDSNKDGSTWLFSTSDGTYYKYNSSNAADDWLISPAIKLEAGKKYHFAIDAACASTSYPEVFEVLIGTEPKASALKQSVLAATQVASKEFATYENETVEVAETGYYHFGIHAISDANMWNLFVANFLVEAGAEPTAPAAVTDFAVAQTPNVLETVVSFKAPTKTVAGDDLTDLTKIDVLRDGNVINSISPSINWVAADQGYENSQDITSIDFGAGLTAALAQNDASTHPRYWANDKSLRLYDKNSMTISGGVIKKVVFTFVSSSNNKLAAEGLVVDGATGTWTGSANEIAFTATGGKAFIQKIEIEYEGTLTPGAEYSYTDNAEDLTVGTHVYQVIPYNTSGIGVKSEEKSIFLSVAYDVPHTFDFSEDLLDLFGVIDNNGDGKTWSWSASNGAYYPYSSSNAADDYLITMPFKLKAGKKYNVIVTARNSGYDEKFEVLAGKEPTVAGLTEKVIPETTISADDEATNSVWNEYEGTFAPAEDGSYNFAIHATSDANMFNLCVSMLTVELAPEETAPAAIADFAVAAGAEGALEANLSFTAPAKAINGNALEGNVDVKIYRDNELVNTLTGVAAGSAQSWKDTNVENGKIYTYYVVAANESGDGLKSEKVSTFIGIDEVGDVANIQVTGTTANTISMSWDAVAGKNGGYVNLADVKYAVVSMHVETVWFWQVLVVDDVLATVTGQTSATFDYPCDEGEQDYKYFGVVALQGDAAAPAAGDEFAGGYTWALVGAPYELPFAESFTGGNLAYGTWAVDGCENTYGFLTGVASDDDCALAITTVDEPGLVRLESGRVNIKGVANPTLLFDAMGIGAANAKVFASKDGGDWEVIATVPVTENYSTVKVSLANVNTERFVRFAIGIDVTNPSIATGYDDNGNVVLDYGDLLLIDNIKIVDLYQYNLVADIQAPKSVVAGQKAKIVATVTNAGENPVKDYVVSITAGNKALTNVIGDKELAPFTKDIIEVDYETSIFDETGDVTLTVNVQYENELLPEDNTASAIITITEPTATAPTSLLAEDKGAAGVDLTWTVNEGGVAEVTESFDDETVFEPFGLGGITADEHSGAFGDWTVYDGNGIGTYGFNGTDFPNAYQPMGFIVFNPSQISEAMAETYAPHSGNQFMVSFCPAEESNAPATDHWMISPELPGTAQTISFFARVITNQYGAETFEVWASSTDNKVENFTKVADYSTDATEWTEFTADLPAGTKYFAIRHTSTDIFGLLIDDVKFSANTAATAASFNIYYNGEKIATVEGDKTTYTVAADKVEVGTQTFGVSAVYANGAESRVTTATIEIVTGIEQIAADGKPVDVYSIDGKLIRNQAKSLDDLKGLYIVNGKKIMVK